VKISLAIVTKNSAEYIRRLLEAGKAFADEIVVAVDASSSDSTEAICGQYADKLFRIDWDPTHPSLEWALAWLNDQCTGDWILRLDDDELPGAEFVRAIPRLIADRDITHYWLERRWVVGQDRSRWIAQFPHWPDWQLRLFRNVRSLVRVPGVLHTSYVVQGACGFWTGGAIYHLDLVYHSEAARRRKVEHYERTAPGKGMPELFLPDVTSLPTRPMSADELPWEAISWASGSRVATGGNGERTSQPGMGSGVTLVREVSTDEVVRAGRDTCEFNPELFRAALTCSECPAVMVAGQIYSLELRLWNGSPVSWPVAGVRAWDVRLTYRWLAEGREVDDPHRLGTHLPHSLRPGETSRLIACVRAPSDPGRYVLQWDLLIENVSWFSAQGWEGPEHDVRVQR